MQLRYSFRIEPTPGQRVALARAFGCARVVFNDALRIREEAHGQGMPFPTSGELSRQVITEAKRTPERAWLAEVLQQSLRDLGAAYRNFFASAAGTRKGSRVGRPRLKARRDHRQAIRFTANARWRITDAGRLRLPKVGEVRVR